MDCLQFYRVFKLLNIIQKLVKVKIENFKKVWNVLLLLQF